MTSAMGDLPLRDAASIMCHHPVSDPPDHTLDRISDTDEGIRLLTLLIGRPIPAMGPHHLVADHQGHDPVLGGADVLGRQCASSKRRRSPGTRQRGADELPRLHRLGFGGRRGQCPQSHGASVAPCVRGRGAGSCSLIQTHRDPVPRRRRRSGSWVRACRHSPSLASANSQSRVAMRPLACLRSSGIRRASARNSLRRSAAARASRRSCSSLHHSGGGLLLFCITKT